MRRTKLLILTELLFLAVFFLAVSLPVHAEDWEELPLMVVSDAEKEKLWRYYSLHSEDHVPENETILSFDVSEEGEIVLVTSGHHLFFMERDGTVTSSFSFSCSGDVGVAWMGKTVCLLFTRGTVMLELSPDGSMKEIYQLHRNDYDVQQAWEALAFREKKETVAGKYTLRRDGIVPLISGKEYSKLVFFDQVLQCERVLYDVSGPARRKTFAIAAIDLTVFALVLIVVIDRRRAANSIREHSLQVESQDKRAQRAQGEHRGRFSVLSERPDLA